MNHSTANSAHTLRPWRRTAHGRRAVGRHRAWRLRRRPCPASPPPSEASSPGAPVNPPGSGMTGHTLPDFTDLVTQVKPAVVSITTRLQAGQRRRRRPGADAVPVPTVPVRRHGAADGPAGARDRGTRLRLHRRCQWHDRHQQPCGEGRQDGVRHAGRWHEASGEGDRARRAHRHRGAQDRCAQSSFPTSSSAIPRT